MKNLNKKQAARLERRKKFNKVNWESQIEKTKRFCKKKGFTVVFEKNEPSIVCFDYKQITINSRTSKERQFYYLLHELGHVLIHENRKKYFHNVGYGIKNFHPTSMTQKISEVEEEFLAWNTGYKKAKSMRLKVDRIEYEKLKALCLSTYFEWAIKKKIDKIIKEKSEEKYRTKMAALRKNNQYNNDENENNNK